MKRYPFLLTTLGAALLLLTIAATENVPDKPLPDLRKQAERLMNDGNYKDALEIFQKLALNTENEPARVGSDMEMAVICLQNLNREDEIDAFREKTVETHPVNWRLLWTTANNYFHGNHSGFIVAGDFHRGQHRGQGRYVNSLERDRVRALQLMALALEKSAGETDKGLLAAFHTDFARQLMGYRGYGEAWRLQYLTDLTTLPDYEEGYGYYHGDDSRGAPVDDQGNPVFHAIPESYTAAGTDGERWRWMLQQAAELNPARKNELQLEFANFLLQQFGCQTMAYYGRFFASADEENKDESGPYALHTLTETETIAKLATGIRRFDLPDEFNFIRIYRKIADAARDGNGEQALQALAQIFENRRQYDQAADFWKTSIRKFGEGSDKWKQKRVDQILNNWCQFEPVMPHPAGGKASVELRFRNGKNVSFEAREIKVPDLLADIKEYLKTNPGQLDWEKMNIEQIGYRLVNGKDGKYLGDKVAEWKLPLEPRANHFDKRLTVETPLTKAGAYFLTAKMEDGNTSSIVIWINDTILVKKQLDRETYFFVADAISGMPLSQINVEFFGYRQESVSRAGRVLSRHFNVLTLQSAEFSDQDGQVIRTEKDMEPNYTWLITATSPEGRLAYLGFTGIWHGQYHDSEYNQQKIFVITDRPVYRPNQPVKFKFWVRHAKYDQEDSSSFAGQNFNVQINDPKGEKIFEKTFTADAFGGFDGEYPLPAGAALGVYSIHIPNYGGSSFRVEEYKKPEFEVTVEAPTEPIMLGEKITAKVQAKYYFGAPVTKAKVKYKVLRSSYSANWYPIGIWDWFYGPGYWWFAYDYAWYPGWGEWGCIRPPFWWWPTQYTPPEMVAEAETEIGADGTIQVSIDTLPAKELHGDSDHRYEITAEITDESRRTIVGQGVVLVARKPFKVYAWVNRGHYRVGDTVEADFNAQTLDNKPVQGKGKLTLFQVTYKNSVPDEKPVQYWNLDTDVEGRAGMQIKASKAGQYRLSYKLTDAANRTIEGGYVFSVMGKGTDNKNFRFNEIELVPDQREYKPGDKVRLMINTDRENSTVVLFIRPSNGVGLRPKIIRLQGKSAVEEIEVTKKDMPNFFVEAFTISGGKLHTDTREIIVPPETRVLNLEVTPSATEYKPGETAKVKVRLTDPDGKPFQGSTVMSVYDKSVEYISGGSNVPEIKAFFWKWRRRHNPRTESNLNRMFGNLVRPGDISMQGIGAFGDWVDSEGDGADGFALGGSAGSGMRREMTGRYETYAARKGMSLDAVAMAPAASAVGMKMDASMEAEAAPAEAGMAEVTIRKDFADTAFWIASLNTDPNGEAEVEFKMPENLTGWKIRTWAMGHGTKVAENTADVVTTKNLLLRMQAPRFFVEKDEVVLSANVHNYLKTRKKVEVVLELPMDLLVPAGVLDFKSQNGIARLAQTVEIDPNGEQRVDWRVSVLKEGEAVIRMKALTDEESDAMEMRFPVYVHGMLKTESFSGVIRREKESSAITFTVPAERRVEQSVLEIRYSPTLAGAMVDALPYLVEYPYGCTEQTLNRFLPTVITAKILKDMGLDLAAIRDKRTNLNAQEIGDDKQRAEQWKRWDRNPVFDEATVSDMVKEGLKQLTAMQLSDGGWGWFSGWGEHSWPHTTAYVVHGLQIAQQNGVALVPGVLERGIQWLERYQAEEVRKLQNAPKEKDPWKRHADDLDAFVYMVLTDAGQKNNDMNEFLYRDRTHLAVYGMAMYGMALSRQNETEKLAMIMQNIEQYLVEDAENQTAYLKLPNSGYWWYWYGSEYEAHAYYLKLLALTDPKSTKAAGLVKYLLNNRKHATYWNSTRDTALCIEALADYLRASGEDKPDMTLEIYLDGQKVKEETITAANLFLFDNKLVLQGTAVRSGEHKVEIRRKGTGPVYFNAYLTNFTLEDFIKRAGLEIKVNRKYYKLVPADKTIKVSGAHGQALDQKVEKYERQEMENSALLKSGDLAEVELEIDSKNDYEYIVFEDMKPAGFEPVEVRSGYNGNDMGAYVEFRDERVAFFIRALARGKHSVAYRLRAEIPGKFSALPTRAHAMYAPELKANSDEIKLRIED